MRECRYCHLEIRYDELMGFWEDVSTRSGDCQENPQAMATASGGNMNVPGPHGPVPHAPRLTRTPAMEANCADLDYYQWRRPVMYDGDFRLLMPHSDPGAYESPFSLMWRSEEEAQAGLEDWGVEEDAIEEHWILVHYTGTIVGEHE